MSFALFALLLLLAVTLLWLDGARARELATGVANELCRRRGFQLLDETVALTRLGLVRTGEGLRLKRLFRFDYSVEGVGRQEGGVLMHGSRAVWVDLPDNTEETEEEPAPAERVEPAAGMGKVIPFRRR